MYLNLQVYGNMIAGAMIHFLEIHQQIQKLYDICEHISTHVPVSTPALRFCRIAFYMIFRVESRHDS